MELAEVSCMWAFSSSCGELLLLYLAHFSLRIKHIHMDAFHTEETICHCASRITRSSDQHIDLLLSFLADEIAQEARHKASAHILECQCGSVEKFQ